MDDGATCPLCGGAGPFRVLEEGLEPPFRVLACPVCDYGFVHPLPDVERLAAAYGESYYEPWREQDVAARRRMWAWRLNEVRRMQPVGRLLEVGDGDFLARAAEQAGFAVRDVTPDRAMVEPAKRVIDAVAALSFHAAGHVGTEAMLLRAVRKEGA